MRVIAVCADGPKAGMEITLVGQSTTETMTVPEVGVPPPIDLGPPLPGEPVRRVFYWYVRSIPDSYAKYLHLYALNEGDQDMTWPAQHPAPSWTLDDPDPGRRAARPASRGLPKRDR